MEPEDTIRRLTARDRNRTVMRATILDAAERLLRRGATADFSMRDLAAEAGVGFATPFNHFGSKAAILQALSSRLIDRMAARYATQTPLRSAGERVLAMAGIACGVLLDEPAVSRAVVGFLGAVSSEPGATLERSAELWRSAIGPDGESPPAEADDLARTLALLFRGAISFWTAGELTDEALLRTVRRAAQTAMQDQEEEGAPAID